MTVDKITQNGRLWSNQKQGSDSETYIITLWPYRSLSVKGFRIFMLVLASLMSAIATGFFLLGAWPVIGFLGAEILIVWFAFRINYRAAQLVETVKITPDYVELQDKSDNDTDKIYIMGLYISFGQNIHNANINDAVEFKNLKTFKEIHNLLEHNSKLLIFITKSEHKIKKKAEQACCENAIKLIEQYNN